MPPDAVIGPIEIVISLIMLSIIGGSLMIWIQSLLDGKKVYTTDSKPLAAWNIGWVNFGIFLSVSVVAVVIAQSFAGILFADFIDTSPKGTITPWVALIAIATLQLPILAIYLLCTSVLEEESQPKGRINTKALPLISAVKKSFYLFLKYLPLIWVCAFFWDLIVQQAVDFGWIEAAPEQAIVTLFTQGGEPIPMALLALSAVFLAPIVEELVFRAGIYRFFKSQFSITLATVFSSTLFALIHFNLASFLPLMIVGAVMAYVYEKEGNILVPICFHAFFNLLSLTLTLLSTQSSFAA